MSKALTYQLAAGGTLEISMVGTIGDGWSEDPITAKGVRKALDSSKNVQSIKAHIDSSGGNFFEGLAIYQMLQEHPADVEITIGARAASAASLIAMAGDTISMHETSTMLVHPVWTIAMGNAAELRKVADEIDQLSESAVTAYAARTGMDAKAMRALMAEDRFMSASEAKKLGFATHIRKAKDNKQSSISESEVRNEIENMRTHAQASAAALRVAAMSPQQPTQTQPAPSNAPVTHEENTMQLAVILAALSLSEGATEAQVVSSINGLKASAEAGNKTLSLLGAKSFDEAQGTVAALNSAKEQGAKDAAELKSLREKSEQSERDGIVAKLEADRKLSPAQKKDLLPTLSLAGLKAFAATAPVLFAGDGKSEPRVENSTPKGGEQPLQHNGKTYAQMSNLERAAMHAEDLELFNRMRDQAIRTGAI